MLSLTAVLSAAVRVSTKFAGSRATGLSSEQAAKQHSISKIGGGNNLLTINKLCILLSIFMPIRSLF